MPQSKHQKKINLLVREGFEASTLGRVLHWALSLGRGIVIITELVVILAFISRFWLDRTLTDLNDQIAVQRAQIESVADFEKTFRSAQERIAAWQSWDEAKIGPRETVQAISALLPAEVSLTNISLLETEDESFKAEIKGLSLTEAGVFGLIRALEAQGKFTEINLAELSLDEIGNLKFTMTARLTK